jgi:hypothetical protein
MDLITRDKGRYSTYFPTVRLISPKWRQGGTTERCSSVDSAPPPLRPIVATNISGIGEYELWISFTNNCEIHDLVMYFYAMPLWGNLLSVLMPPICDGPVKRTTLHHSGECRVGSEASYPRITIWY